MRVASMQDLVCVDELLLDAYSQRMQFMHVSGFGFHCALR